MTRPINYQKQTIPAYSGITINITNPTLNAAPLETSYQQNYPNTYPQQAYATFENVPNLAGQNYVSYPQYGYNNAYGQNSNNMAQQYNTTGYNTSNTSDNISAVESSSNVNGYSSNSSLQTQQLSSNSGYNTNSTTQNSNSQDINKQITGIQRVETSTPIGTQNSPMGTQNISTETLPTNNFQNKTPQAYPPQYYLNNYNYIQNGEKGNNQTAGTSQPAINNPNSQNSAGIPQYSNPTQVIEEQDLSASQGIIQSLDSRVAEQKELEKNGKKTKIIALTNEYIMSLENYLNNPNSEIRLMASKEVLKRLDEDKDRFDDAALNALLNKMLQDPNKLIRIAAMSAFSSQLASGNNFTVSLLKNIQANPNSDKEDVLQAADILLKMSSTTQIKYVPAKKSENRSSNKDLEASQKQVEQLRSQLQKYKEKEIEQMLQLPKGK